MKKIYIIVLAILIFFTFKTTVNASNTIYLNEDNIILNINEKFDLDIIGNEDPIKWLSYNANIASVNEDGVVYAQKVGKTIIRARIGSKYKFCNVKIVNPSLKINKTSATIYHGGTSTNFVKLKATVKGATKNVIWSSLDESIAIVDQNGNVTSVSEGTTTIKASANGLEKNCKITVKESNLILNLQEMQLSTKGVGSSIKITPTVIGSKKNVKWTTTDKTIATVSSGKVTGKKSGKATITATANGISKTCEVIVVNNLVSINEENVVVYVGENKTLKTNATKRATLTWTSSNENVASINNGIVTAKTPGVAIISVENNGKSDSCIIVVKDTTTSIVEEKVSMQTKGTNKTYNLKYDIVGRKTSVKWTSSNPSIASVSKGKITAKKAGETIITATANGVSDSAIITVSTCDPTISLNYNAYTLYTTKGNTITLKATINGASKTVTYTSSNPECALVNNKGKVTGLSEGTSIITAAANGVFAQCFITVKETSIIFDEENLLMQKNDVKTLGVDIIGPSQNIKWTSSNKKVANVKNGTITAIQNGETIITATANGVKKECLVKVADCIHTFDDGICIEEPTCEKKGIIKYTCILCGYNYDEYIPIVDHDYIEIDKKEPTCTETGYIYYECKYCKDYKEEILSNSGHTFDQGVITKEPTCTEEGIKTFTCIICKDYYTETINSIDHEYIEYSKVEPTCEKNGIIVFKCKTCELSYEEDIITQGHSFSDWEIIKEPTEEEQGEKKRTCDFCEKEEIEYIEKIPHTHKYEKTIIAPTCTEEGYTICKCKCNDEFITDYVNATGHDYGDWIVSKEPTETEEGEKTSTCSLCEDVISSVIPKLEHSHIYEKIVTPPTCKEKGYTTYTCKCGDSYIDDYTDVTNHVEGEPIITIEANCQHIGMEEIHCIYCDLILKTNTIPLSDHIYEMVITKKPTCTENGEKQEICSVCNNIKGKYIIEGKHQYDYENPIYYKEPSQGVSETINDFGEKHFSCNICQSVQKCTIINIDIGNNETKQLTGIFYDDILYETVPLINELRTSLGLNEVEWRENWEIKGKQRAAEIQFYYSHDRPNNNLRPWSENMAKTTTLKTSQEIFDMWKNSPGHYENMINKNHKGYYGSCFVSEEGYTWIQMLY